MTSSQQPPEGAQEERRSDVGAYYTHKNRHLCFLQDAPDNTSRITLLQTSSQNVLVHHHAVSHCLSTVCFFLFWTGSIISERNDLICPGSERDRTLNHRGDARRLNASLPAG